MPSPGGRSRRWRGPQAGAVGRWVRGTRHLLDLPEGYRTRTPGARSGRSAGGWSGRVRPGTSRGRALPGRGDGAPVPHWSGSTTARKAAGRHHDASHSPTWPSTAWHGEQARQPGAPCPSTVEPHSGRSHRLGRERASPVGVGRSVERLRLHQTQRRPQGGALNRAGRAASGRPRATRGYNRCSIRPAK